eukprot:scaffold20698_cov87-Phaeocystis_antarctica.AAC.2
MPRGDALAVLACGVITGIKVRRSRYDLTVPRTMVLWGGEATPVLEVIWGGGVARVGPDARA